MSLSDRSTMRARALGLVIVAAVVASVVLVIARRREHAPTSRDASAGVVGHGARPPGQAFAQPKGPADPIAGRRFIEAKAQALVRLRQELEARVRGCAAASPSAPAQPHTVALSLEWDSTLSTPELQRFTVADARVVGGDTPVSAATGGCLQRLGSATLNVLVPYDALPAKLLEEPMMLLLP